MEFWKRTRLAVYGVLACLAIAVPTVYWRSEAILGHDFSISDAELVLAIEPGPDRVGRGQHIASAIAQCQFCHGGDLSGSPVIDDPWLGRLFTPNLTRGEGGIGSAYSEADWVRAIRFGVRRNGRSLLLQPSEHLSAMSDLDLAAVISYMSQLPAVDSHQPSTRFGPLIRFGMTVGLTPDLLSAPMVDRSRKSPRDVSAERTVDYGAYLTDIGNCRFCHRADLSGGLHPLAQPGEPVPPDLRRNGSMAGWSRKEFARAMREGWTPDGRRLDTEFMPWPAFAGLSDLEVDALWLYLRSIVPLKRDSTEALSEGSMR